MIFPTVALMVMVGCVSPVTDPDTIARCGDAPSQERAERYAEDAIARINFVDPESVRITNVSVSGLRKWSMPQFSGVGWQVSFYVNAKNRMGGYAGPKRYLVLVKPDGSWFAKEASQFDS